RLQVAKKLAPADFAHVDRLIDFLFALDPNSGTGWYYRGEARRRAGSAELGRDAFKQYLAVEKSLPPEDRRTNKASLRGYFPERTAWIQHLLARDYLQLAERTQQHDEKCEFW